jgi:hypothetical protein
MTGWRHAIVMAGHSRCRRRHVRGRESREICRRVGPWFPPAWRALRSAGASRRNSAAGCAVEAARASIDWAFANFDLDRIIHCIDSENTASQGVARRLGAQKDREIELFGHVADLWVTPRDAWTAQPRG